MPRRDPRTVLTTGANSGIGLSTAILLARRGFRSVASVRSEEKADHVEKAAADAGVEVHTVLLDVTDSASCAAVIEETRPWGLVNNAGYSGVGAVEDVGDDEVRLQLETMVVAPMRLARLALAFMKEAREGKIVNVSSIYGLTTTPFSGWYQASKHALEAVSDALRLEVARYGVKVVLVEPGGFKTGIWEKLETDVSLRAGSDYEDDYRRMLALLKPLMVFMGAPESVAKTIGHALSTRSPRARYLVGRDAQALAATAALVPAAIRDRAIRVMMGL